MLINSPFNKGSPFVSSTAITATGNARRHYDQPEHLNSAQLSHSTFSYSEALKPNLTQFPHFTSPQSLSSLHVSPPFDHLSFPHSFPWRSLPAYTDHSCLHSSFCETHSFCASLLHSSLNNAIRHLVYRAEISLHPSVSLTIISPIFFQKVLKVN